MKRKSRRGAAAYDMGEIAATTFEAIPVDRGAYAGERWQKTMRDEGVMRRVLQVVLAHDDASLTEIVARDPETFMTIAEKLDGQRRYYAAGAESFQCGCARLCVALARVTSN
jgi:hypothetical protein